MSVRVASGVLILLSCTFVQAQLPTKSKKQDVARWKRMSWKVGDDTREALVYAPHKSDKKAPIVFAYHGHGGKAEFSARKFAFQDHWPEAVCVYPQGLPTAVPKIDVEGKRSGWQKYVGDQKDRDLAFFDEMLKSLSKDHNVDPKRVYVTGHSNGGFFTYVLAASRGDQLAAIAPVAANISVRDFKNQKPLPTLHVAGEKDPIVPFVGQQRSIEQIKKLNECVGEGKPAGKNCMLFASSKGTPLVTFIHPGGHEVPDGAPERIAEFFKEQSGK